MTVSATNKLLLHKELFLKIRKTCIYSPTNSENHYQKGYLNRFKSGDREIVRRTAKTSKTQDKIESSRPVLIMNENSYFSSANWLAPSLLFPVSLTQTTLSFAFYFFFDSEVTGTLVIRFYLQSRPAIQGNLVWKSFKEVTLNRKNWYKLVINQPISDALRG